jgi:sulfite exporter TauE/SafE
VFGLDQWVESLGRSGSPAVVLAVAVLLGIRHAADPDHLVAVSTLVATERDGPWRRASRLGLAWGLGHATTLVALGIPIVLFSRYLPAGLRRAAEALVGVVIVALALRLLRHWRAGQFHVHEHEHDGFVHRHLHGHGDGRAHRHDDAAYGVGLVHGVGGSAGVGLLLLASIDDRAAFAALALFAAAAALSMSVLSLGAGYLLARRRFPGLVPGFATAAVLFGLWYAVGPLAP